MPPSSSDHARLPSTVSGTCSVKRCSLKVPSAPPSPLAPLSEMQHHERVVEHAQALELGEDASDLRVGVRQEAGEDLLLARQHPPGVSRQRAPLVDPPGANAQLGPGGDDPARQLPGEHLVAPVVPAAVERARVRLDPLRCDVVRRVHGTEREVEEERTVGRGLVLRGDRPDGPVGEVLGEVVAATVSRRRLLHVVVVLHQVRRPVVGVTLQEAVVPLEAEPERPAVERPRRRALAAGHEVPLPDRERVVPLVAQHPRQRRGRLRHPAGVSGKRHGEVGEESHADRVVVAPGHEARAGRRAEAGDVEVVVPQAVGGQAVHRGRGDAGAEAPQLPEAQVVEHDQHDVRRARGRAREGVVAGRRLLDRRSGHRQRSHAADLARDRSPAANSACDQPVSHDAGDRWARGDLNPHVLADTGT